MLTSALAENDFAALKAFDTCTISNAIERLHVRPRNEGFAAGSIRCLFPDRPPMVGYAVTGSVRTSTQPVAGGWYFDSVDWWKHVSTVPAPRVLVLQDVDDLPGFGAFIGAVHASIAAALGCIGCVTNGAVRDLPASQSMGFQLFASSVSPSHAYSHLIDWGKPVKIGQLAVADGDLLHGDLHGVCNVPLSIAIRVPAVARQLLQEERDLIELCSSADFSLDALSRMLTRMRRAHDESNPLPTTDRLGLS